MRRGNGVVLDCSSGKGLSRRTKWAKNRYDQTDLCEIWVWYYVCHYKEYVGITMD